MAKRLNIITYPSDEVQGEGSFVKVRAITWGESKRLALAFEGMDMADKFSAADEQVVRRVVEWNWVDDEGVVLPLPKDDPTVVDRLTDAERGFLARVFGGKAEEKN